MSDILQTRLSGKFIVFDGPDGCGKTTQLKALITRLESGMRSGGPAGAVGGGGVGGLKVRRLREPGGTPIGEQIRDLLLSTNTKEMDVRCEMLLYMASRAELVKEQILPALAAGECVVSDRYASSTLAYQGGGGGLPLDEILQVASVAIAGRWPDLTVIFDLDTDEAMSRLNPLLRKKGGPTDQHALFQDADLKDRIEQRARDYFQRVRENYLWQAKQWPDRYRIVDAGKSIPQVEKQVWKVLEEFFSQPPKT